MSNAHNANTLMKLATSVAKLIEDSEKISLPIFTVKLAKAQQTYPEDHTIGMMATVVGKMANSDKLFISRAEVKDLYEKFYTRNTKFAHVFADEIGQVETLPAPKVHVKPKEINIDLMQEAFDNIVDPVLASALDKAFGGNKVKEYSTSLAKQAAAVCCNIFKDLGFKVQSEVVCGKDNILICSIAFETPRGMTNILVPVETDGSNILYNPSVFVGNTGSEDISKETVVAYLTSKAGDKLYVRAEEVLQAALIAQGSDKEVSDVDLALTKLNAQKESVADYLGPQVLGVEVEQANSNLVLNLPEIEDPEITSIAKTFDSELGFANFKFGSKVIAQGGTLIENQLNNCGINNSTIAIFSSNDDSIIYSVALNGGTVAFKVPLKIENQHVLPPTILLCNGSVKSFDKESLTSLLREEGFDRTAALSASPLYGIKPSELVSIVRNAVAEGNYIKAEDALNVLSESDDKKAYEIALIAFTNGLKKQDLQSEEISKCCMIVKNNHTQYELCGHTGLPLHKVFQDKYGNCQPLYRKGMADSYEGASFMNSKVYL